LHRQLVDEEVAHLRVNELLVELVHLRPGLLNLLLDAAPHALVASRGLDLQLGEEGLFELVLQHQQLPLVLLHGEALVHELHAHAATQQRLVLRVG